MWIGYDPASDTIEQLRERDVVGAADYRAEYEAYFNATRARPT